MPDEQIFSSEYLTEESQLEQDSIEDRDLNSPGTGPVALGKAIVQGLRQYGTGKPQWQVIIAKIHHA